MWRPASLCLSGLDDGSDCYRLPALNTYLCVCVYYTLLVSWPCMFYLIQNMPYQCLCNNKKKKTYLCTKLTTFITVLFQPSFWHLCSVFSPVAAPVINYDHVGSKYFFDINAYGTVWQVMIGYVTTNNCKVLGVDILGSWPFGSWHFGSWHSGSWQFGKNPTLALCVILSKIHGVDLMYAWSNFSTCLLYRYGI